MDNSNRNTILLLLVMLGVFIIIFSAFYYDMTLKIVDAKKRIAESETVNQTVIEYNNTVNHYSKAVVEYKEKQIFVPGPCGLFCDILSVNANLQTYEVAKYDCTEFSHNLAEQLNVAGWKAEPILIITDCDSGIFDVNICKASDGRHEVVKISGPIYVEGTTGEIISPKDYAAYGLKR